MGAEADRLRLFVRDFGGSGLLAPQPELSRRFADAAPHLGPSPDELTLLAVLSPRVCLFPDIECIYEESSYADLVGKFLRLAPDAFAGARVSSTLDGNAEQATIDLELRGCRHFLELSQSTDYAQASEVLAWLNTIAGPGGRHFHTLGSGEDYVGFLDAGEAAFLRARGQLLDRPVEPGIDLDPRRPGPVAAASEPPPARRPWAAVAGLVLLLGVVGAGKAMLGVKRAEREPKASASAGIALDAGKSLDGRELLLEPGRLILVVRCHEGSVHVAFTPYDFLKNEEAAAAARIERGGTEVPAGAVREFELKAERAAFLWSVRNDGPGPARVEVSQRKP